jgi:uncharacterized LabA/DUF88 family protein
VTTQHTHPEHNDADFIAEGALSASESDTSSSGQDFSPAAPESLTQANNTVEGVHSSSYTGLQFSPRTEHVSPGGENTTEPAADVESQTGEAVSPTTTPFANEEAVRPFSDFIEEFRQKEERFQTALEAYAVETHQPVTEPDPAPADSAMPAENVTDTNKQAMPFIGESAARPVSPLLRPAARLRVPRHSNTRHREVAPSVEKLAASTEAKTPQSKTAPGVEEITAETSQADVTTASAPVEEQSRPPRRYRFDRPAATTASPTTPVQPQTRPENGHTAVTVGNEQSVERGMSPAQSAKPAINNTPVAEQAVPKQPVAQETAPTEVTPASQEQDRKRRHGHERPVFNGKEQPQTQAQAQLSATPVVEAPVPPTEPVASQQAEVVPEDLPPLEYSELQKASSRRRRRRPHTGTPTPLTPGISAAASTLSGNATNATNPANAAKTITPEAPAVQQPSVVTPRTPVSPASTAPTPTGQYSITSGYTVNQMNQGNGDSTSPFMGPDPSPARGTIAAQKTRSIRTDAQRTPVYPMRSTEPNPASLQQIANVITQSFQIQTDRMIAEMRRASQGPTNISVAVPQFPSNERVGVFVDVANLLYSARTLRINIDFGKLLDFLRGNRRLVRAHAYCPTSPQPGDEQMFLQAVKGLGYRITTKNYKTFASGAKKADLDLDLCMDVVRLVDGKAVDDIVLVSGDSDFMPMLDYCSDHGVRVEVAGFDEAMSATLRQSCDVFINLAMLEEIRVRV